MNLQRALEIFGLSNLNHLDSRGLKTLFKKLAKEKHPDQGGNHKDFVLLKEAHLVLEKEVESNEQYDSTSTNLRAFSKEDILNKYYQDTSQLQGELEVLKVNLDDQAETLDQVTLGAQQVLEKFTEEKEKLKKELDLSIEKLEKSYNPGLLQKILFFLPKLNENEFWEAYQQQVNKYTKRNADLDTELYRIMLSVYGEGLNNIARLVGKVD